MPTIKLQDGTEVHISQESYDALAKAVQESKELTYQDIAIKLFRDNTSYYTGANGRVYQIGATNIATNDPNTSPTENQCKQLLALNMLHNVAYYLNEGWVPDWENNYESKYYIHLFGNKLILGSFNKARCTEVYFKSEALAQRAITILGEAKVKEAFGIFE